MTESEKIYFDKVMNALEIKDNTVTGVTSAECQMYRVEKKHQNVNIDAGFGIIIQKKKGQLERVIIVVGGVCSSYTGKEAQDICNKVEEKYVVQPQQPCIKKHKQNQR